MAITEAPDHWMRNGYACFEPHHDAVACFTAAQVESMVRKARIDELNSSIEVLRKSSIPSDGFYNAMAVIFGAWSLCAIADWIDQAVGAFIRGW